MTVFSRTESIPKIPVSRRSSVTSAKPFFMASCGLLFFIFLSSKTIAENSDFLSPKMLSSSSLLPAPSSPAMPKISPFCKVKFIFLSFKSSVVRFFNEKSSLPISLFFEGYLFFNSRPTISLIISSVVMSEAAFVAM